MRYTTLIVTAAAVVLGACGSATDPYGGGASSGGGGRNATITVGNNFFSPTPDTVSAGTLTFSWATPSSGHTLTWDSGPGTLPSNTGTLTSGTQTVTVQAGTYHYHCAIHGTAGTGMRGTIVVE